MSNRSSKLAVADALPLLRSRSTRQLLTQWQDVFGTAPPAGLTRDLLVRGLAYRLQEQAGGGLSKACQRALRSLAGHRAEKGAGKTSGIVAPLPPTLSPGMRLVRDWGGRTHTVSVVEGGFEYRGERFRSLTGIARRITGAGWSGPRFFGVGS